MTTVQIVHDSQSLTDAIDDACKRWQQTPSRPLAIFLDLETKQYDVADYYMWRRRRYLKGEQISIPIFCGNFDTFLQLSNRVL